MKKILITSGGTKEYIDEVRVLTNISTGRLGALIADTFINGFDITEETKKYEIHFVYVKGSELPKLKILTKMYEVTDVQSVYNIMEKLVPEMDVVIHPMAVSDFGFRPTNKKLKSNDPEAFIQSLKDRIYQTPKILSFVKKWNPNCFLISFKFENGLEHDKLIEIATESMVKNGSDVVVANDKAEIKRRYSHISYFVTKDGVTEVDGKEDIAAEILKIVK